jgi:malonate-semialdehyde dehydrogenase (acetylating)/methylmalonate-semialdehyde dehydrogenase
METLKNYMNGIWIESETDKFIDVENPGTGKILAQLPISTKQEIDFAVERAKNAFQTWKNLPIPKRMKFLSKLEILLERDFDEIAMITTMENGKTFKESQGDTNRLLENVYAARGIPSLIQGNILPNIVYRKDEYFDIHYERAPVGVYACISPFNFPGMIQFWFLATAVACGNTFIAKQSSETPLTMTKIFELIDEAGFPPGVLTLIQGNREIGDYLIEHPDICGVCSVTSTPVAEHIYKKCGEYGKIPICLGGAKNFGVVMPDANLKKTVPGLISSCFGNAGERCLAIPNVIAVGDVYDELLEMLLKQASQIKVGYGLDANTTMGPVISERAKTRIEGYIQTGINEGAKLVIDGRNVKVEKYPNGHWLGASIFTNVEPEMIIAKEEIFGPVMMIIRAENLEEAIKIINQSEFGNATSIFTSSLKSAAQFKAQVECGMVGINVGVVGPIGWFPFGGTKKSKLGILSGQSGTLDFFTNQKVVDTRSW